MKRIEQPHILCSKVNYSIFLNKHTICLKQNWAMEKCQGTCTYKRTPKSVSVDNKITAFHISVSFGD